MPRNAREIAVGYPHHVTQRGNNREPVFLDDEDRLTYLEFLSYYAQKYQLDIWAYCLMTNHVHLLVVPHEPDSLARGIGLVNMMYTRHVNRKYKRTGRIWQNRFFSSIVETDQYLWTLLGHSWDTLGTLTRVSQDEPVTCVSLIECFPQLR